MAYGNSMYDYTADELVKYLGNASVSEALHALEATDVCKFFAWRNGDKKLLVNVRFRDEGCLCESGASLAWLCINNEDFRLPAQKKARKDLELEFVVCPDVPANAYSKHAQDHVAPARHALRVLVDTLKSVNAQWHYGNAY